MEEMVNNTDPETVVWSPRKRSFMIQQAMLRPKCCELISSIKFHCLLMKKSSHWQWPSHQKVCESLKPSNGNWKWGWRARTQNIWMKMLQQMMNGVSSGLILLKASQSLKALTVTAYIWNKFCQIIALFSLICYFPFAWIWRAALGYDVNSTCKERKGKSHLDTERDAFPTVKSSKSMPILSSTFSLEGLSIFFLCFAQSSAIGLSSLCSSALTEEEKQCFVTMTYPVIFPKWWAHPDYSKGILIFYQWRLVAQFPVSFLKIQ